MRHNSVKICVSKVGYFILLNELSLLAQSLAVNGLSVPSRDSRIKPFKKGPAYIVRLDTKGKIARVELMSAEAVSKLLRISPQNEKSFPGFNLNHPVYQVDPIWLAAVGKQAWEQIAHSLGTLTLAGEKKDRRQMEGHLRFPQQDLASVFADADDLAPTLELIRRMRDLEVEPFLGDLGRAVAVGVKRGELEPVPALALLFGKLNKKQGNLEAVKATLILDLEDARRFGHSVASEEAADAWNRAMLDYTGTEVPGATINCSLSGLPDTFIGDKMPQPNLPALGLTYLMSMNPATPCQSRYGMSSTAIYPIGERSGQRLSDALHFVTSADREGKTFAKVPSGSSDSSDLLIAYLEDAPDSGLPIADLFADLGDSPDGMSGLYEERTKKLIDALRGKGANITDTAIRIFAISKLDPGRYQVLFGGRYCVAELEAGLREWFRGMRNLPALYLPFPGGKGQKAEWRAPSRPSPIDVLRTFKTLWIRQGAESASVPGVDLGQIYDLMLGRDAEIARPLLNRLLGLVEALMCGLGMLWTNPKAVPDRGRKEGLIVLPVIGLLLLKLGFRREEYMESREYLVGQFLQLADRLHKVYCDEVRKGAVPPQLAGNAVLGSALQSPERAFQMVCQRIRVYLAWADTVTGEKAGLAIWLRRRIGEVCRQLAEQQGPSVRIDDAGRAQLFLGYLGDLKNKEQEA